MILKSMKGFSLLEVLISMVIIAIGLLGMAALQVKSQQAELESYQRAQALLLLQEMYKRMNNNRRAINCYLTANTGNAYVGNGVEPSDVSGCGDSQVARDVADEDFSDWDDLLDGASETFAGNNVGAMIGARGCITSVGDIYTISVAWQGLTDTVTPANNCGSGLYGVDENKRRVASLSLRIADLNN